MFICNESDEDLEKSGVYAITNLKNGKRYIGSTKYFRKRANNNFGDLKNSNHCNKHLQASVKKYGQDNFEFRIIEICKKEKCSEREQIRLDIIFWFGLRPDGDHDNFYNINPNADHGPGFCGEKNPMFGRTGENHPSFGTHHTEETKEKQRQAKTGKKNPMFGRVGEKSPRFGKHHTEESRKKQSESKKGIKHSSYISDIMAENVNTDEKIIAQSVSDLAIKLNVSRQVISNRLYTTHKRYTETPINGIWKISRVNFKEDVK